MKNPNKMASESADGPFLKRSRIDDKPRMFGVLDSLDDEDIQEDADAYQQKLAAGSSDSEAEAEGEGEESPLPYEPLPQIHLPPIHHRPILPDPELTQGEQQASIKESPQPQESGLIEGYGSSSEEEQEDDSEAQDTVSASTLQKLGLKDPSKLETIAAEDIRDKNWSYTSNNVWTPAKMPMEHGTHQKRKHQITWLASSAVEDEQRIQDLAQKARENRHKSRLKYGF
eukprot:Protomagalhaensia_wolfi_Nauph_80__6161@NODE_903_length_1896_cov_422_543888_g680_i0_p1_GENE_NODE_903_length_1896_cov_422_543888_g680_i0NODE_903_length_1896_cov_422_543888_g680_i0_p1_ORF_typecomplete_len228_score51_53PRCC/PF10253_9/5_2e11RLL/PF10036_9/0_097_NODE_903_length_1896_cov_422_543888_g680_i048731